jgi:hypothetical protein
MNPIIESLLADIEDAITNATQVRLLPKRDPKVTWADAFPTHEALGRGAT